MGKNIFYKAANFQENALGVEKRFEGVTLLPYIQGDGASYIDTEIVTDDHCIILDYQQSAYRTTTQFGTYDRVGANRMYMTVTTDGNFGVGFGGNTQISVIPPISQKVDLNRRTIAYNTKDHHITYNGISMYDGSKSFAPNTSGLTTYLFTFNRYGVTPSTSLATFRLFSCKMVNNKTGEVTAYIFPARRNADGAIGMYDTINKKFLPNRGSGVFLTTDQYV